jgi:hypothetical protein
MHYVSLIVEFLRGRPAVVFWGAALSQAALWFIVPALFYSAPPGEVPTVLAIGHEFRLGSYMGPPLAFWLAEIAFRLGGIVGVYFLAQVCLVVTLWAVFKLGRAIVGTRHAVLAILLMTGILVFSVRSPEFGPATVAMPLWALALLHYWRAVGDDRRGYWFLLAVDLGLLMLADYSGLLLLLLLLLFTLLLRRGRETLRGVDPWLALSLFAIVVFPHAVWLTGSWRLMFAEFAAPPPREVLLSPGLWFLLVLVLAHSGALLLIMFASGWRLRARERAPEIDRVPAERDGRLYIYTGALAPPLIVLVLVLWFDRLGPAGRVAPFILLTALAVIVAAGDRIRLYRERTLSLSWLALLLAPPILVALSVIALPWTLAIDLRTGQPARDMGNFFADIFQRRTGKPLTFVSGDPQLAALVAVSSPARPSVYFAAAPDKSPWADVAMLRANGAILVWSATDTAGSPPAALRAAFPEMVPELPRAFARPVQGLLPLVRIGWAVLRPQNSTR